MEQGGDFKAIEGLKKLDGSDASVELDGRVTLVDFWATWCPPCQAPMAHNQEMLEKHADWEGKVRIVGVSLDQAIEPIKQRVDDKGWHKVEHYWRNANNLSEWNFKGIPHVALMSKDGKIVFKGHPMSTNLEDEINKLI